MRFLVKKWLRQTQENGRLIMIAGMAPEFVFFSKQGKKEKDHFKRREPEFEPGSFGS